MANGKAGGATRRGVLIGGCDCKGGVAVQEVGVANGGRGVAKRRAVGNGGSP